MSGPFVLVAVAIFLLLRAFLLPGLNDSDSFCVLLFCTVAALHLVVIAEPIRFFFLSVWLCPYFPFMEDKYPALFALPSPPSPPHHRE